MLIVPTLHCNGRCEEAIALYKEALNLTVDYLGKDESTGRIYHCEAHIGAQRLRLCDGDPEKTVQAGSLFLAVVLDNTDEVQRVFDILAEGGTVVDAPHNPGYATCMSELKDKFGFKWTIMVD